MNPGLTRPLKVGDKVWSKRFGYGQVTHISPDPVARYPHTVRFSDNECTFTEIFSINGIYKLSRPNTNTDLAGPLRKDGAIEPKEPVKIVQTIAVKKENGHQEGTIIDIDGCKIFRSGDSMVILPQNDDL